jgi:hypothetical protein
MGTVLQLDNGANLDTPFINVMGTLRTPVIGVNESVKIKLAGDRNIPSSSGDPTEGRIMVMSGGTLDLQGPSNQLKTPYTRLLGTVNNGDTTIQVTGVNGWKVGDILGISQSTMYAWETEEKVILGISTSGSTKTITLNSPLSYTHYGSTNPNYEVTVNGKTKSMDVRTVVSNLSRPIEIYTDAADAYGAHIMKMASANSLTMTGVQLSRLGMSTPSDFPYQPNGDAGPTEGRFDSPSGTGLAGKYSVHWHLNGDASRGDYCKNVVTYRSRHKSFVVHASHGVELDYCVSYRGWSHQFSIGEDGKTLDCTASNNLIQYFRRLYNANNVFTGDTDFAFKSGSSGVLTENRITGGSWQNEIHPGGFWITTPSIIMKNNIVSGGIAGVGFYFDFVGSRGDGTMDELIPSVEYETMLFTGNQACGLIAEGGHKFGTTQDVIQGVNNTSVGIGFSYRTSGVALWMDQFDPDRPTTGRGSFEYLVNDFTAYSCTAFAWTESPAFRLTDFLGFHIGKGCMPFGGFFEDGIMVKRDILGEDEGIIADTRNPALHPDFGNLSNDDEHYEGYWLNRGTVDGGTVKANMDDILAPAFNVWSTDKSADMKIFKRMHSLKNVYVDGYTNYIRVTHAHEGPFYITDWSLTNKDTRMNSVFDTSDIVVNLQLSGLGNTNTTGVGPSAHDQINADTEVKYLSTNTFNAGVMDLDNNLLYVGDGTTRVADTYVYIRVTARGSDELNIIANKADNAATWYDTNHAIRYSSGFTRHNHELYDRSSTAITRESSNITFTSSAADIQIDVYGAVDGAIATVNSSDILYNANNYRDGFNVNYLLDGIAPPPTTNNASNVFGQDLYVDAIVINTTSTPLFT